MNQTNKPNYPMPSYEGLYFLQKHISGNVERLLPNGQYLITYMSEATLETKEMTAYKRELETNTQFFLTLEAMVIARCNQRNAQDEYNQRKWEREERKEKLSQHIAKSLVKEKVDARNRKKATQ